MRWLFLALLVWPLVAMSQTPRDTLVLYFMLEGCKKSTVRYSDFYGVAKPVYLSYSRRRLFFVDWVDRPGRRGRWKFITIQKF